MAELTYIEHLNIPKKERGHILHAYEYNATVNKINEIVDNLHTSYELSKDFPRFDKIDNIFPTAGKGAPVVINDKNGKLYPITSSTYVLIDDEKNLDDELAYLNSQINSGLTDVLGKIELTNELINTNLAYSYSYAYTSAEALVGDLRTYVDDLNTYLTDIIKELEEQHTIDVSNILSYIPSYVAGFGITINDENKVSVNTSEIVDGHSIYVNSYGQLVVNNDVVLAGAENKFKFIDENGNWVGDMANVKNYIDNSVNGVRDDLTTYIENNATNITELRSYVDTEVQKIYTYVNKFTEYDLYGKTYQLSYEFMETQK